MDKRPVGVFDSGLGGLTVVSKLREIMPCEDIVYLGDTGRVPYGGRSRSTIQRYARQDIAFLLRSDIKAVVAACGTVSTNGLDEIAPEFNIPVCGVAESAAKAAAKVTKNGKIGLIGTKASVASGAYDAFLRRFLPEVEIIKKACPLFVPLVEDGRVTDEDKALRVVADEYLEPLANSGIDTLIMGCTHYPLIQSVIQARMPGVTLIDPGKETALDLFEYLTATDLKNGCPDTGTVRYYVTDSPDSFAVNASLFLREDVEGDVRFVTLDEI